MDGTRAEELVERYADAILRIGYTWLGDMDDAKDICQTVLIKLVEEGRRFPDLGQERAWVVRLSVNACKNWKKSAWFRRRAPLEEGLHLAAEVPEPEDGALLALEARRPAPRRQIPLRRVAALAACAGLVLGLVNYQAVAAGTELVITGRYAPAELIDIADLVTEMREVKHYYTEGVLSRNGIDR